MQMPTDLGTIHIMGIGGIGMSAIAEVLAAKGFSVQGSDQKDSANVQRLRRLGMRVFVGHDGANVNGARFVVISTAVKDSNPELAKLVARQLLDNALIAAGLLEDARDTVARMNTLMEKAMG